MSKTNTEIEDYSTNINSLLDITGFRFSDILPSDWAEKNRVMSSNVSSMPGKYSFKPTPYTREILDTISPTHPARKIAVQKGAQIGLSVGLIENGIGYIIDEAPGPILFLTASTELVEEAMKTKIDDMLQSTGLLKHIKPNVIKSKNQRTGHTAKNLEFAGGTLTAGSVSNHKLLRQRSVRYIFADDFEAAPMASKESGDTAALMEQRAAAFAQKSKIYYISTPELQDRSNIEKQYLLGDQRRWYVPCPCCGDYIIIEWKIEVEGEVFGIVYERDSTGALVEGSVGYKCQSCKEVFTEKHKYEMNLSGEWRPTCEPSEPGFYSYKISALNAAPQMTGWTEYVRQYLKANPLDQPQNEREMQTFMNVVLSETFRPEGESPKANKLQGNVRDYEIGLIPEKISIKDGNGQVVLLTCACDLNGKIDDARLDYEIVAWFENGSNYSIEHGSIGTFIPNQTQRQKDKDDRLHYTYMINEAYNVWDDFQKVISKVYETDTGKRMKIIITGVDTGNTYGGNAYSFLDKCNGLVVGLKGKDEDKSRKFGVDTATFRPAKERGNLYLLEVNQLKDELAEMMKLNWDVNSGKDQPSGYMNYPIPSRGLYLYPNYFAHFESEHKIVDKNADGNGISARWIKKNSVVQNHLWDCRVYNMALRDIMVALLCKESGLKTYSWADYVDIILGNNKK